MDANVSSAAAYFLGISAGFLFFRGGSVRDFTHRHRVAESSLHLADAAKTLPGLRRVAPQFRRLLQTLRKKIVNCLLSVVCCLLAGVEKLFQQTTNHMQQTIRSFTLSTAFCTDQAALKYALAIPGG
jgi:hypothetical protein